MKPRTIDDQIRQYYENHRLSDEVRSRLKAKLQAGSVEPVHASNRWWWTQTAVAAGIVMVVMTAVLWLAVPRNAAPESSHGLGETVAQQAALGHNERHELEFRASRTAELREAMKSLDFAPVEPDMMAGMNMHLVGARYTTIEGVMAAQILYVDPKGEPCTLYQARPVARLATLRDGDHDVDGLRVSVWREKGLLMVLARPLA